MSYKPQSLYRGVRGSIAKHYCDLPFQDDVPVPPPYAHPFVKWWFSTSKYRTVARTSVSLDYFRSNRSFARERERHLSNKALSITIHPFSPAAEIEGYIMLVVWGFMLFVIPLMGSFVYKGYMEGTALDADHPVAITMWLFRGVMVIDVIFRFFLGYTVPKTQTVVLEPKMIAKKYLKTFFFVDTSNCINMVILFAMTRSPPLYRVIVFQLNYILLVRFHTFLRLYEGLLKKLNFQTNARICFKLFTCAFYIVHWWTCILRLVSVIYELKKSPNYEHSWFNEYRTEMVALEVGRRRTNDNDVNLIRSYFNTMGIVMCHFFGASIGRYPSKDSTERLLLSLIIVSGLTFYIYATAKILELFGTINVSESMFEDLLFQAKEYMVTRKYPKQIGRRIIKYYNYKYDKKFFSEQKILDGLTEHLRMEVLLYSCKSLIENLNPFKGLPRTIVGTLFSLLKPEIYLPKDVVMTAGEDDKIFFVLYGTCSVQLVSGLELLHREDGDTFGDADYYLFGHYNTTFIYKVVAIEPCEIYTLNKEDAKWCCTHYPELAERLQNLSLMREKLYNEVYSKAGQSDSLDSLEIISELRKKRILHHGRPRVNVD